MDSNRAKEIINSQDVIRVLYQDSAVWLDGVKDNNVAQVTRLDGKDKLEVPVYLLVEDGPLNKS